MPGLFYSSSILTLKLFPRINASFTTSANSLSGTSIFILAPFPAPLNVIADCISGSDASNSIIFNPHAIYCGTYSTSVLKDPVDDTLLKNHVLLNGECGPHSFRTVHIFPQTCLLLLFDFSPDILLSAYCNISTFPRIYRHLPLDNPLNHYLTIPINQYLLFFLHVQFLL